jgi:hypothetical protein
MVSKTGEAESITSHYLFALGSYRGLYILNWIYRSDRCKSTVRVSLINTGFRFRKKWARKDWLEPIRLQYDLNKLISKDEVSVPAGHTIDYQ